MTNFPTYLKNSPILALPIILPHTPHIVPAFQHCRRSSDRDRQETCKHSQKIDGEGSKKRCGFASPTTVVTITSCSVSFLQSLWALGTPCDGSHRLIRFCGSHHMICGTTQIIAVSVTIIRDPRGWDEICAYPFFFFVPQCHISYFNFRERLGSHVTSAVR